MIDRFRLRVRRRIVRKLAPLRLSRLRKHHPRVAKTIDRVLAEHLTYSELPALLDLAEAMLEAERSGRPGCVIEAGTAYGGSALVLAAAKRPERPLHLYDAFGPFPAPGAGDPEDAHRRHAEIAGGEATWLGGRPFYSYVDDLVDHLQRSFADFGLDPDANNVTFVQGLIEERLEVEEPVALAHVDCDWFDPVVACLERIGPWVATGGRIVIDDYDDWQGARRAVDEYVSAHADFEPRRRSRLQLVRTA